MTSLSYNVGDIVYVPFWVVIDALDTTPPHAFIKCRLLNLRQKVVTSPSGQTSIDVCDLELDKPGLVTSDLPLQYLITAAELPQWAERISKWFLDYTRAINAEN